MKLCSGYELKSLRLKASEASGEKTYENLVEATIPRMGRGITAVFTLLLVFGALSGFLVCLLYQVFADFVDYHRRYYVW